MLRDITLGQYHPGDSCVHRLDPRTKLVLTIAYIAAVFLVRGFVGYALAAAFLLGATRLATISVRFLLKGVKPLVMILAFTFVLNVLFAPGETVWLTWGALRVTREGVLTALYFSLRLVFLVMGTSLLTLTTSPVALTDAMERLLSPLRAVRFPVHELAMMMSIALRFIPTLLEETDKIMKAQMARGADFESGNLLRRARAMVPLLVPLFVSAFQRAAELAMAMEARCYRGGTHRTRMKVLRYTRLDGVAAACMALLIALIALEGRLYG
ncbi:MAG: energy-coupling factor transporter transmembrane protein EcfT [Oscillospiraceae bacterium]|nr:energy-coupling factor transporter transmembrane protein EcfT [Oscillospiraceae bacterium]